MLDGDRKHRGDVTIGESVEGPLAVAAIIDQITIAQDAELVTHPGAADAAHAREIADAQVPRTECEKDAQASRISERVVDVYDGLGDRRRRKRVYHIIDDLLVSKVDGALCIPIIM